MEESIVLSDQRDAKLGRLLVTMCQCLPHHRPPKADDLQPHWYYHRRVPIVLDLWVVPKISVLSEPEPTSPGGGPAGGGATVGEAGQEKESHGVQCLPDHHLSRHTLLLLLPHPPAGSHLLRSVQLHGPQPFLCFTVRNFSNHFLSIQELYANLDVERRYIQWSRVSSRAI